MARNTLYTPARGQEYPRAVWGYPGALAIVEGIHAPVELSLWPGWKVVLVGCWLNVEEEPSGDDLICDIQYCEDTWDTPRGSRTWNSIFGATKPTILDGMMQSEGVLTKFATYPEPMELRNVWAPEGDTVKILFRADITQASGSGLTMSLDMHLVSDY